MAKKRVIRLFLLLFALLGVAITTSCGDSEPTGDGIGTVFQPATVPSGFVDEVVRQRTHQPHGDGVRAGRTPFRCQQDGAAARDQERRAAATPFLTVNVNAVGERGLLGVTFDPNFATNHFVYVYYTTATPPIHNRLSRFTANGDVAVAGSEVQLLNLDDLSSATNHNGGAMHFGTDGKLYVAVGENANGANAQSFTNLLGKMLRLNSDGTIPSDNPFFNTGVPGNNRAIWALGLRNPVHVLRSSPGPGGCSSTTSVRSPGRRSTTASRDRTTAGRRPRAMTTNPNFRSPLFVYGHGRRRTTRAARSPAAPSTTRPRYSFPTSFVGKYFYADFCNDWIRVFDPAADTAAAFATGVSDPVDLRVGSDGALYYLARGAGQVGRIRFTGQPAARDHDPSRQPDGRGRPIGDVQVSRHRDRSRSATSGSETARTSRAPRSPSYTISSAATGDNGATFRSVVTNAFGTRPATARR